MITKDNKNNQVNNLSAKLLGSYTQSNSLNEIF